MSSYQDQIVTFTAPDEYCVLEFSLQVIDNDFNYSEYDYVSITVGGLTIYDIQYTDVQGDYCYESTSDGLEATISGVITHVTPANRFFLQDSNSSTWNGMYIFDSSLSPVLGDEVSVSGTVEEYYSQTELKDVTSFTVISSGNLITPLMIDASDLGIACSFSGEQYESVLVALTDITFQSIDEFGNLTATDNGGGSFMVDDYHYNGDWPTISVGSSYDCISGVVAYSYGEFKVYPRNINDFSCYQTCTASGDVNMDGSVSVSDIILIVNHILIIDLLNSEEACIADVNQDGLVDILDIIGVVNIILD